MDKLSIEDVEDCDCESCECDYPNPEGLFDPKDCYFCIIPSNNDVDDDLDVVISTKNTFNTEGYIDDFLGDESFDCDLGMENLMESTWGCKESEKDEVIQRLKDLGFEYSDKMEEFCKQCS